MIRDLRLKIKLTKGGSLRLFAARSYQLKQKTADVNPWSFIKQSRLV